MNPDQIMYCSRNDTLDYQTVGPHLVLEEWIWTKWGWRLLAHGGSPKIILTIFKHFVLGWRKSDALKGPC